MIGLPLLALLVLILLSDIRRVLSGGAFSVLIVPVLCSCFRAGGALVLVSPAAWSNLWLGLCFGGLHILFGAMIARKYGG